MPQKLSFDTTALTWTLHMNYYIHFYLVVPFSQLFLTYCNKSTGLILTFAYMTTLFVKVSQIKQDLKNTVTDEDDVHDRIESGVLTAGSM
jgi:uncharacterized protein YwgA